MTAEDRYRLSRERCRAPIMRPLPAMAGALFLSVILAADAAGKRGAAKPDFRGCVTSACHGEVVKAFESLHRPLLDDGCGACHLGSASAHPGEEGREFHLAGGKGSAHCLRCHAALEEKIEHALSVHGAVKQGLCTSCHNPHGSGFSMLLERKWVVSHIVPPYASEISELCWNCHPRELSLAVETESATAFRDGRRNLHAAHTSEKKGRSCKACHDAHAGSQEAIMRNFVPFGTGGWVLPIEFTRTRNGGRCVVGCHRERTYRR